MIVFHENIRYRNTCYGLSKVTLLKRWGVSSTFILILTLTLSRLTVLFHFRPGVFRRACPVNASPMNPNCPSDRISHSLPVGQTEPTGHPTTTKKLGRPC